MEIYEFAEDEICCVVADKSHFIAFGRRFWQRQWKIEIENGKRVMQTRRILAEKRDSQQNGRTENEAKKQQNVSKISRLSVTQK